MRLPVVNATFLMTRRKTLARKQTPVPDKPVRESTPRKKTCGEPSSEKEILRSQTQVLSQLAGSLNQLVESHTKGQLEQMNYEKERDKAFLEFKKQEAEKTVSMR